jgi:hypothetical protein
LIALCVASSFITHSALSTETLWVEDSNDIKLDTKDAAFVTLDINDV